MTDASTCDTSTASTSDTAIPAAPAAAPPASALPASAAPAPAAPPDDLVARLNATRGELNERMGILFTEAGPERVVATMPVEGNRQPYGLLHGGASVVLAESIGSTAAMLNADPGAAAVGIEINATHHRAVTSGTVTATATRVHAGRTLATFDIRILDEAARPVCSCRLTCMLRARPPGGGALGRPPDNLRPGNRPGGAPEPRAISTIQ